MMMTTTAETMETQTCGGNQFQALLVTQNTATLTLRRIRFFNVPHMMMMMTTRFADDLVQ
jgi:hypothetical protein